MAAALRTFRQITHFAYFEVEKRTTASSALKACCGPERLTAGFTGHRHQRNVGRRIKAATFAATKSKPSYVVVRFCFGIVCERVALHLWNKKRGKIDPRLREVSSQHQTGCDAKFFPLTSEI